MEKSNSVSIWIRKIKSGRQSITKTREWLTDKKEETENSCQVGCVLGSGWQANEKTARKPD